MNKKFGKHLSKDTQVPNKHLQRCFTSLSGKYKLKQWDIISCQLECPKSTTPNTSGVAKQQEISFTAGEKA